MLAAMASANLLSASLGILATFLLEDPGINRTQVGALITASVIVTAIASPMVGAAADALGGRVSLAIVFVASAVGFLGTALSPVFWVMFVPVSLAAIGQAGANPATNKLIARHTPPGRRGVVTGIKQSGVQVGVFLGGLALPSLALAVGWRWAMAVAAIGPLALLPVSLVLVPRDAPRTRSRWTVRGPVAPLIRFLAVYGGLIGFGVAYTFLVPLFVEESLGLSERAGGLAAGMTGLVAVFGRIGWARLAETRLRREAALFVIASVSVAGAACYLGATRLGVWAVCFGVVLTGLGASSSTSVVMLAVMGESDGEAAGRASGVAMLGFLAGLGAAPTLYGWTVDATGSYTTMWVVSMVSFAAAALLAAGWLRRLQRRVGYAPAGGDTA